MRCGVVRDLLVQVKEELMTSLGLQEEEGSALQALRRGYKVSALTYLPASSCGPMCWTLDGMRCKHVTPGVYAPLHPGPCITRGSWLP